MSKENCTTCGKTKSMLCCEVCAVSVCKNCAQFIDEDTFTFLDTKKPEMALTTFCNTCFDQHISPDLISYNETTEAAKNVSIYFNHQGKETRLMKRIDILFTVSNCADRDEVLMRLGFKAVQAGYNAVIDVNLVGTKVRLGSYQTSTYNATGIPTNLRPETIVHDRSIWQNRN
jgi:hypothetical protein